MAHSGRGDRWVVRRTGDRRPRTRWRGHVASLPKGGAAARSSARGAFAAAAADRRLETDGFADSRDRASRVRACALAAATASAWTTSGATRATYTRANRGGHVCRAGIARAGCWCQCHMGRGRARVGLLASRARCIPAQRRSARVALATGGRRSRGRGCYISWPANRRACPASRGDASPCRVRPDRPRRVRGCGQHRHLRWDTLEAPHRELSPEQRRDGRARATARACTEAVGLEQALVLERLVRYATMGLVQRREVLGL